MEEQLVKLLEKASYTIDKVIENSPEIIEGYIRYKTIGYILYPILFISILLLIIFVGRQFGKKEESFCYDIRFFGRYFRFEGVFLWIAFVLFSIISIIQLFASIDGLILINTNKELFIIENILKNK